MEISTDLSSPKAIGLVRIAECIEGDASFDVADLTILSSVLSEAIEFLTSDYPEEVSPTHIQEVLREVGDACHESMKTLKEGEEEEEED